MASTWPLSTATSCHRGDARRSQRCPWGLEPLLITFSTQQSLWRTRQVSVAAQGLSLWHWKRTVRQARWAVHFVKLEWIYRMCLWNNTQGGSNICSCTMRRPCLSLLCKKWGCLGSCRLLRKLEQNGFFFFCISILLVLLVTGSAGSWVQGLDLNWTGRLLVCLRAHVVIERRWLWFPYNGTFSLIPETGVLLMKDCM